MNCKIVSETDTRSGEKGSWPGTFWRGLCWFRHLDNDVDVGGKVISVTWGPCSMPIMVGSYYSIFYHHAALQTAWHCTGRTQIILWTHKHHENPLPVFSKVSVRRAMEKTDLFYCFKLILLWKLIEQIIKDLFQEYFITQNNSQGNFWHTYSTATSDSQTCWTMLCIFQL